LALLCAGQHGINVRGGRAPTVECVWMTVAQWSCSIRAVSHPAVGAPSDRVAVGPVCGVDVLCLASRWTLGDVSFDRVCCA
jgi:hypothetical protein